MLSPSISGVNILFSISLLQIEPGGPSSSMTPFSGKGYHRLAVSRLAAGTEIEYKFYHKWLQLRPRRAILNSRLPQRQEGESLDEKSDGGFIGPVGARKPHTDRLRRRDSQDQDRRHDRTEVKSTAIFVEIPDYSKREESGGFG